MSARRLAALLDRLGAPGAPLPPDTDAPVVVAIDHGDSAVALAHAAMRRLDGTRPVIEPPAAADWPFVHPVVVPEDWPRHAVIWVPDLHEAFVNHQTNSTRLVTTQPLFVLQVWLDALAGRPDVALMAAADAAAMAQHAPEAAAGRGPWRRVRTIGAAASVVAATAPSPSFVGLPAAFRDPSPEARLAACGRALDAARTAPHLLAMASTCMEVNDLDNARALLDEAVAAAPAWTAAHFEQGKLRLRLDDMDGAAAAFGHASALMPTFASAAANWGATLGELDRPEAALAAFTRALDADPTNHQALNNLGVVSRELGRLPESEQAFRQVIALTPDLAFGHYNLGHTLFLQGRYHAALAAYVAGQQRDPARSPVQASRLALARLATGDAAGALRDLQACTAALPADYRRQVLSDAHAVAWALLSTAPALPGWAQVGDWLSAELAR